MFSSLMAALAEFERDLLRERVRSGIAAAQGRGVNFGRQPSVRIKADRYTDRLLRLRVQGQSYGEIARVLQLSKNTVMSILHRQTSGTETSTGPTVPPVERSS